MPVAWIDVTKLSFNVLLLLERVQLSWFPGWLPEPELGTALNANPAVAWYMRHKCPEIAEWLDQVLTQAASPLPQGERLGVGDASPPLPEGEGLGVRADVRAAEIKVMNSINDLLVYAVDPALYDALPFLGWDSAELNGLADFSGKTVVDVGAGTGRLAFVAAEEGAHAVFAVEPVANLRCYIKAKALENGLTNVFAVDGLITDLPFPDDFGDVVMGGHVFGDDPQAEHAELVRVAKPGGMVILCPGNNDRDEGWHQFLVGQGFEWSRFEEPGDGIKRKYWKVV